MVRTPLVEAVGWLTESLVAASEPVLKAVAQGLADQLRVSVTLGRLGGEEFGVLLQDIEGERR